MKKKPKKFKVKTITNFCIGAASCEIISPKVFYLDKNGRVKIKRQKTKADKRGFQAVSEDVLENVLAGAKSCPVQAIIICNEDGEQIYP